MATHVSFLYDNGGQAEGQLSIDFAHEHSCHYYTNSIATSSAINYISARHYG